MDGYYIVKNEDFVYNPRISTSAPVGPINRNKLGRTGVMSPLYTVFRPHDIDTTYLEYFFKCGYWHSFMNFNGDLMRFEETGESVKEAQEWAKSKDDDCPFE